MSTPNADVRRTILVADDSAVARAALKRALLPAGFAVVEATSLAEARAFDPSPLFAAVLDLDLGDGTGVEAARALQAAHPSLKLAFFSSGDDAALTDEARAIAPVFIKPRELDRVVAWVVSL